MALRDRITPQDIDACITKVQYYVFPDSTVTCCLLTLTNGYTVLGESACVNLANFCKQTGEDYAFKDAKEKIWRLEGYLLKDQLYKASQEAK